MTRLRPTASLWARASNTLPWEASCREQGKLLPRREPFKVDRMHLLWPVYLPS